MNIPKQVQALRAYWASLAPREQSLVLASQTPPSLFPGKTLTYRAR